MRKIILLLLAAALLASCNGNEQDMKLLPVNAEETSQSSPFIVRHVVQGGQVFVECIVSGVSFTNNDSKGQKGKAVVSVNGQRFQEYYTAAFILKSLPRGTHHIKVDILTRDNKPTDLSKQFYVRIP